MMWLGLRYGKEFGSQQDWTRDYDRTLRFDEEEFWIVFDRVGHEARQHICVAG
jgi:hypothetical protein